MIQQQIEFLRGFKIGLEQRGFKVDKFDDQVIANKYFRIFDNISFACRFTWYWHSPESVQVDIRVEDFWVARRFLTCLIMDYSGGFNEVLATVIRNVMRDIADEVTIKMLPK